MLADLLSRNTNNGSVAIVHWIWLGFGLLLALLLCFIPLGDSGGPEVSSVLDAGHFPLFGFVTLCFYLAFLQRRNLLSLETRLQTAAIMGVSLAAIIELLQPMVGRSSSWIDLVNGALGVGCITWIARLYELPPRFIERLSCVVFLFTASLIVAWPVYQQFVEMQIRLARFPVLADFQSASEVDYWIAEHGEHSTTRTKIQIDGNDTSLHADAQTSTPQHEERRSTSALDHAQRKLKVILGDGRWSGVSFYTPIRNWMAYKVLAFSLCRSSSDLTLAIRIDDTHLSAKPSDRFNRLLPSPAEDLCQLIEIPLLDVKLGPKKRELDLSKIKRMVVFSANAPRASSTGSWFSIDDVLLR